MENRDDSDPHDIFDPGENGTVLVDATDLNNPKLMEGQTGFFFFASDAPEDVKELSAQWLTEIVVGDKAEADTVLADAVRSVVENKGDQPLNLSLDYNCTDCGRNARIVRRGLTDVNTTWSYILVDGRELPNQRVAAGEIWLSNRGDLTPEQVNGREFLRPGAAGKIDGAAIAKRIAEARKRTAAK